MNYSEFMAGLRCAGAMALGLVLASSFGCTLTRHNSGTGASTLVLSVNPSALQVPAGGSGFATVTVSRPSGLTGAVTFALTGAPSGVVAEGSVPAGAATGQLTLAVAADVAPQTLDNLTLVGQAGAIQGDAGFTLVVAPALPASSLSPDLVNAAGAAQQNGTVSNTAVALEPVAADLASANSGSVAVRHGFLPVPNPSLP